jgi:DNA-binding MarR family transcriptional regulator
MKESAKTRTRKTAAAEPAASARRRARPPRDEPGARLDEVDAGFEPHVAGVDYGTLDDLVGYAMRRAQLHMYEDFYRTLAPWRISPQRYSALTVVALNPGLRLTQLGHILGIAGSGTVMVVRALEALDYVERRAAEGDARAHALHVTAAGRRALRQIDAAVREQDARMTAVLSADERQALVRMLSRLAGDDADGRRRPRRR